MNTTMNETQSSSCPSASTAEKIGMTFAGSLSLIVSLTGNTVIGIIVYKTKTMRKPINFFIVNMAMSDLLYPIIWIPRGIQKLHIDSWLIGCPLGLALCKLIVFLGDLSDAVSIQSLVLIAVDRFILVLWHFLSVLHSSVQSCVRSSFSPLGSSRWLLAPQNSSPSNLLNILENWFVSDTGMKFLESPHPLRITSCPI